MSHINVGFINWMQSTFGQGWRPFFDVFSTLGGPAGWLLVRALAFWLSGSNAGLRVGFSTAIATITNDMLKWSFTLPRPYYVNEDQFVLIEPAVSFRM